MICWLPLLLCFSLAKADDAEFKLYKDLSKRYNNLVRPVLNNSRPVVVSIGIVLQQIIAVNEKDQVVQVNAWLTYGWRDESLYWDPANYAGITDVRFSVDRIWKPDVLLYNSADSNFDSTYPSNLVVYHDGSVNWIPPGIFKSSCKMDVTWFPFDDQSCYLKFGSWSYHGYALDLVAQNNVMDTSEYLTNGEWVLMSAPVRREVKVYTSAPEPYPSVTFYLNIRRRTTYYLLNVILPCFLISMMTLLGFCLPPECGEKITIEMTVLLSVCFFLSVIAEMVPTTSETTPLIGTFFVSCMVVVSMSVVFTVIVLNLHYRTSHTHKMTGMTRTILLHWLPRALRMKSPLGDGFGDKVSPQTWSVTAINARLESDSLVRNVEPNYSSYTIKNLVNDRIPAINKTQYKGLASPNENFAFATYHQEVGVHDSAVQGIKIALDHIYQQLLFVTRRMEKKDDEDNCMAEWKFAAQVIDRLCLVFFTCFLAISTLSSVVKVAYFKEEI